ncbi:MAG: endopeptidase La [Clostridiales bacterium]|nr:endopeptidase La [Clostridiales bacterium]
MANEKKKKTLQLPVLPLRGLMVFPYMVLHFDVGRISSVAALEQAMLEKQEIFLVAQINAETEDPKLEDLQKVGTVARIKQVLNLPGDNLRVLVEGLHRGVLQSIDETEPFMIGEILPSKDGKKQSIELEALARTTRQFFEEYAKTSMKISGETLRSIGEIQNAGQLADVIAANALSEQADKQMILEKLNVTQRLEALCGILLKETELANVEKQIQTRIKNQIEKNQKEYYLREQIKAIQTELGDGEATDVEELREKMEKTPLSEEARTKVEKELERLSRMAPGTPEISVSRTYVEWILDLPWGKESKEKINIKKAKGILEKDHYGLKDVKQRVIEYLAVLQMKQNMKGPILCFVGPPGVGKTSIARSIAKATGREFAHMSLGGVRDEAEIRGHRRTYIGAIPGRIISEIKQSNSMNPVFLFDEIDKMASDFRGDPASAMLEVLDGEQNHSFKDHYLELPFDLSKVLFITTANTMDTIPAPLRDRMEIIEVSSYTFEEKYEIARRHLLPKQVELHGLDAKSIALDARTLRYVIQAYTREAGVRTLEKTLGAIVRKAAVQMLEKDLKEIKVTKSVVEEYLGAPIFLEDVLEKNPMVGVVNGLAYTSVGGEMLAVECAIMPGTGILQLTGHLGEVMKESAQAALSWVRSKSTLLGIDEQFHKKTDIHIHVPQGAIPKDGPSAGITITTALVSALTGIPVKQDVAMTGEITLRGRVLPIGGLKEKSMAAYRMGIKTLIIPKENEKDIEEIPERVKSAFTIITAKQVEEVLAKALVHMPTGTEKKKIEKAMEKIEVLPQESAQPKPIHVEKQNGGSAWKL